MEQLCQHARLPLMTQKSASSSDLLTARFFWDAAWSCQYFNPLFGFPDFCSCIINNCWNLQGSIHTEAKKKKKKKGQWNQLHNSYNYHTYKILSNQEMQTLCQESNVWNSNYPKACWIICLAPKVDCLVTQLLKTSQSQININLSDLSQINLAPRASLIHLTTFSPFFSVPPFYVHQSLNYRSIFRCARVKVSESSDCLQLLPHYNLASASKCRRITDSVR